ncbi:MAG: 50S ribosomal protein L24 [Elusimicrobiota bacterium]
MALGIKKKDTVVILSGKDRGKKGEVLEVMPQEGRVVVAKVNLVKKHRKTAREKPGGILTIEAPLALGKVALVCPKCAQPAKPRIQFLGDGTRVRVCRQCGEQIL